VLLAGSGSNFDLFGSVNDFAHLKAGDVTGPIRQSIRQPGFDQVDRMTSCRNSPEAGTAAPDSVNQ